MGELTKQLPLTDRFKGVLEVFDRWPAVIRGPCYGDDIEPRWMLQQTVGLEERERGAGEPTLFPSVHRLRRMATRLRLPRLDFNEDDGAAVDGDQVEFSQRGPLPARNNTIALPPQIAGRQCLSALA